MARRKRRASKRRKRRSTRCQTVTVKGRRRKICRNSKGRITSNTAAGSRRRKRKR